MKINYIFRQVFKAKGTNIIKFVSLTLGLAVSTVLFTRVANELSYEKFYPELDRIAYITTNVSFGTDGYEGRYISAGVTGGLSENIPEIECSTTVEDLSEESVSVNGQFYKSFIIYPDSNFFKVFDPGGVTGNPEEELSVKGSAYISRTLASKIFKGKNAIGEQIIIPLTKDTITVKGLFDEVPCNTHLRYDIVVSTAGESRENWMGQDHFFGYVKLASGINIDIVNKKIAEVAKSKFPPESLKQMGLNSISYYSTPLDEMHLLEGSAKRMNIIISSLAFIIVVIAALNYVLISISSLASRTKTIAAQKSNGATNKNIFNQLVTETLLYLVVSIIFSFILIFSLKGFVEPFFKAPVVTIFSLRNLWAVGAVTLVMFVFSAIIPAKIFSSVNIAELIRKTKDKNTLWKQALLFTQFAGATFLLSLLTIISIQYNKLLNTNMGYSADNVAFMWIPCENEEAQSMVRNELEQIQGVKSVSITDGTPFGTSGWYVRDSETDGKNFSAKVVFAYTSNYAENMGVKISQGTTLIQSDSMMNAVVNKVFLKTIGWTDDPVGKFMDLSGFRVKVVGVAEELRLGSAAEESKPFIIVSGSYGASRGTFNLFFDKLTLQNIKSIDEKLKKIYPESDIEIMTYNEVRDSLYEDTMIFRNSVTITSIVIVLIALLGTAGFVNDELQRKTKEIAIRRIYGADITSIVRLITQKIGINTMLGTVTGAVASYYFSRNWLEQFYDKINLSVWIFVVGAVLVMVLVLIYVAILTIKKSRQNPVESIK